MDEKTLRAKIINDEIKSQESDLNILKKESAEYSKKLTENKVRASFIEDTIKRHKSDLESLGVDYKPDKKTHVSGQISQSTTLQILKDNDIPNGLMVKHVVKFYDDMGIKTHGRAVFRHLEDLMSENLAYQTNPDAERGRRYRVYTELA